MARGQRNWSEATKAAVIAACEKGTPILEVEKIYNVPETTIRRWLLLDPAFLAPKVEDEKKRLDQKAEEVAHLVIDAMPDKIGDAPLHSCSTAFGTLIDKMRLMREEPTEIHGEAPLSVSEQEQRAAALLERANLRLVKTGTDG